MLVSKTNHLNLILTNNFVIILVTNKGLAPFYLPDLESMKTQNDFFQGIASTPASMW